MPLSISHQADLPRRSRRGHSTRTALVEAAERLIADQGISRVSVAQIARAADQRSRAATSYYFKTLEELVIAVLEQRGPGIRARRAAMLAELKLAGREHDIRSIVEAVVLPVTSLLGSSGAHFRCVVQLNTAFGADKHQYLHPEDLDHVADWKARLGAELGHLPEQTRSLRIDLAYELCTMALAQFEENLEGDSGFDIAFASRGLVDAVTAVLVGPGGAP